MNMSQWKVRLKSTGQFSPGGGRATAANPDEFTSRGRTWTNSGHVKTHLRAVIESNVGWEKRFHKVKILDTLKGMEVVEYSADHPDGKATDAATFLLGES